MKSFLRLFKLTLLLVSIGHLSYSGAAPLEYNSLYPHTRIKTDLPPEIEKDLSRIINYRFGTLPQSNMLTTEVRSYVEPEKTYRFNTGSLKLVAKPDRPVFVSSRIVVPKHLEFQGRWTSDYAKARKEANVLGNYGSLYLQSNSITVARDEPTPEKLAYYGAILLDSGEEVTIKAPFALPVTVVKFEKNYENGYLKLPSHGGGYYLEKHDTPHLWSHLDKNGGGVVILGKEVAKNRYHLTAFPLPLGKAIYTPGGVLHCDGLLIGDIMAIYTVTPDYSSVILKGPSGEVADLKLL